jgi:hypothetical protein
VGKQAFDCGFDEVGGEEGKRDCHVHFADAAPLAFCNAFRVSIPAASRLSDEEPSIR